jgi:hypothetical protein
MAIQIGSKALIPNPAPLREAADKDYQLTVLSDGCADADNEVHNILLSKVFPRQAEVISVSDWVNI